MNNEIVVCFEKGGQKDMAEAFADESAPKFQKSQVQS